MKISPSTLVYFGFLENRNLRGIQPCTLEAFALTYLKRKVKEAGFQYNDAGRLQYVDDCRELVDYDSPETVTREEAANEAAHILTFSNVMIIDIDAHSSVSTGMLNAISDIIRVKLMDSIVKAA